MRETRSAEIDALLAPIKALLTPAYATASDEVYGTNPRVESIHPDDLRAALAEARRRSVIPPEATAPADPSEEGR